VTETRTEPLARAASRSGPARCRAKFLRFFPKGFADETYLAWERNYKWETHRRWRAALGKPAFGRMLREGAFLEIASRAVAIEARTHLLFSFEKMALRDAVREKAGARAFAEGLHGFLYAKAPPQRRFESWVAAVASLPHERSRVLTWPIVTVFGMIAEPRHHIYVKPLVTQRAARAYGHDLAYATPPNWESYASCLGFALRVRRDLADLRPRDLIDVQSFLWVQWSDEYSED
jgi:hypothetical protein